MSDVGSGFERVVGELRLRRPTARDLTAYTLLHTDPRTYSHAPEAMPDRTRCRIRLEQDLAHWDEHGFGYLAVEEAATGRLVGWGGVRRYPHAETLNLYYRLSHDRLGRGYGRLLARAVTESATEWLPAHTVRASVRVTNVPSLRTATAAGLVRIGVAARPDDPADAPVSDLMELPRVEADGPARALLREPDGTVAGVAVWEADTSMPVTLDLSLSPAPSRRNLDGLLLAGVRAVRGRAL